MHVSYPALHRGTKHFFPITGNFWKPRPARNNARTTRKPRKTKRRRSPALATVHERTVSSASGLATHPVARARAPISNLEDRFFSGSPFKRRDVLDAVVFFTRNNRTPLPRCPRGGAARLRSQRTPSSAATNAGDGPTFPRAISRTLKRLKMLTSSAEYAR